MSAPANPAPLAIDQALVHTWPLYEMRRMRAATSPLRVADAGAAPEGQRWCNVFTHARKLLRAGESRVVTPNNDTLYTNAWLDLSAGPLVLQVPDTAGRYYVLGFLDFFTNPFAHVGQRLTGTAARRFFVTGPGWQGEVPAEFRAPGAHIQSTTDWVWIIGRIYVNGNDDIPHVNALQDGFALTLPDGRPARRPFTPGIDPKAPATGQQVLTQVNAALADNPPPPEAAALLAPWAALGVAAGAAPTPAQCAGVDEALPRVLALLRQAGDAGADASAAPTDGAGRAWSSMPLVQGSFGRNHLLRARVALQYIGMLESAEAMYPMSRRDGGGRPLNGAHAYRLRFAPGQLPPVHAFWSLTMYDSRDCMLVPNAIDRYAIGDRTPGLVPDEDGGLSLHIAQREPTDPRARANWLPAPAGDFYLCLRAYLPKPEMTTGRYQLPAVQRITATAEALA